MNIFFTVPWLLTASCLSRFCLEIFPGFGIATKMLSLIFLQTVPFFLLVFG